ncbi:MAG: putative Ig domain-containing protein [Geobacteraceae bacterium]|nr:putative Ig domain-containing protein [Geobacteraceae bacterium]
MNSYAGIITKLRSLMLTLMLVILFSNPVCAETTWQTVGPSSSRVRSLAIDPADSQIIYCGTKNGLYKSTNGGASWKESHSGISNLYIRALAIDQVDSQTLYAATDDGVYKSINGSSSWQAINNGQSGLTNGVYSLAMDPSNRLTIYAGTQTNGVYKTIDGGTSWTEANFGISAERVHTLAIDKNDTRILYAGLDYGVFTSTDGGASWTASTLTDVYAAIISIDPSNSLNIYAAANFDGAYKTSDGGATWTAVSSWLPGKNIKIFTVDPSDSQTIYAGTYTGEVFKTTDGGTSWTGTIIGVSTTEITGLILDPSNSLTIYVGSNGGGVSKTTNGGTAWNAISNGMINTWVYALAVDPVNSQIVYAATRSGGVYKTINAGTSWSTVNNGIADVFVYSLIIDPANSQTLCAGTSKGVYKTTNGGELWVPANSGMPATPFSVYSLSIAPNNSQVIYAATETGVYKSINGGATWTAANSGLNIQAPPSSLAIDPINNQVIYAFTTEGIFKTSTGGDLWESIGQMNLPEPPGFIAIDPKNSLTIFAQTNTFEGTNPVFHKSTDGGLTWNPASNGLPDPSVRQLIFDPSDSQVMYAGISGGGLFKTINGGVGWFSFSTGMPANPEISAFAIDPKNPQTVYAGTYESGIFKTLFSDDIPVITSTDTTYFTRGVSGSFQLTGSGWPAPKFSVSGALPNGISFNEDTGVLSGTPALGSEGTYPLFVTAANGVPPDATRVLTLTVLPASTAIITTTISSPANGQSLASLVNISGTAIGTGITKIEVQVTDGLKYLQPDGTFALLPVWVDATGTASWLLTTSTVSWLEGVTYRISARAVISGNVRTKPTSSQFNILVSNTKSDTTLTFTSSFATLRLGDTPAIAGRLTLWDGTPISGQGLSLLITPPATGSIQNPSVIDIPLTTTDSLGNFSSGSLTQFTSPGVYLIQARFNGTVALAPATATQSLGFMSKSGYAIIVVGKTNSADPELFDQHLASATAIYDSLINKRGFLDTDIKLLISNKTGAAVSKAEIQNAITVWARDKIISAPGPLYLIMIDHGSAGPQGGFVIGSVTLTPSELNGYLNTLETDASVIASGALDTYKRFLIVGTCYSGLFQSLSKPGRVIISSSAATEQSLAGSVSYTGNTTSLAGGDFFIDTLFSFLGRGDSFTNAFSQASTDVALRDPRTVPLGIHSGVIDTRAQHPLLNDNGDNIATYDLEGAADGVAAASLYLGEGIRVPAGGNPADIISVAVSPSNILAVGTSSATISLQVNDNSRVDRAWVEISTPNTTAGTGGTGQVIPGNLDSMPLIYDGLKWVGDYSGFTTAGTYHVYYYTRDNKTGDISPMVHSVAYKKKDTNTPPSTFSLVSPADASVQNPPTIMTWQNSTDSDGLTYTLLVATDGPSDANFNNSIIYRQEDLHTPMTIVPDSALKNPAVPGSYYCQNSTSWCWWKVQAIDAYGEMTESEKRSFTVVKTNALTVFVKAVVTSGGLPVNMASCTVNPGNTVSSLPDGTCLMTASDTPVSVDVNADYYVPQSSISVPAPVKNVSKLSSPIDLVANTLTTSLGGTSSGSVNCSTSEGSVNCNGPIKYNFDVTLHTTPGWMSLPVVWGGNCSGASPPDCILPINGPKSVSAAFNPNIQANVGGTSCSSLTEAYGYATDGSTIKAITGYVFHEKLDVNINKTVTIDGGYSNLANSTGDGVGSTILQGTGDYTLSIKSGRLNVRGLKVR